MSKRNGDRSRFQINQKRKLKLRQRVRELFAAALSRRAEPAKTS